MSAGKVKKVKIKEEVDVKKEFDVVVVGGGAAGIGAAIGAARNGMKTLLIEHNGALGGLSTLGLVCYLAGYPEGVGKELFGRLKEEEGMLDSPRIGDPETIKYVSEQMVLEAGAKILYWTYVIDSIVKNGVLKGVVVQNKSGRYAILSKVVVDCSGDADVAYYSGVPCESGWDRMGGYNQAVSLDFVMNNVNIKSFQPKDFYSTIQMKIEEAAKKGELPRLIEKGYLGPFPRKAGDMSDVYVCTAHSRRCRALDAEDLTRIVIEQRKQIQQLVKFYRKNVTGFENAYLSYTASILGVRESRRIVGEYVLTGEDVACARKFKDAVTRDTHGFDIHNPVNDLPHIKHAHLKEPKEPAFCVPDPEGGYKAYLKPGQYYEIPYRCLVPLKIDNLLVAGRCLSADFEAQSGARLIMTCMTMGQSAGTAAALSIKERVKPRSLDTDVLRDTLFKQDVDMINKPPVYVKGGPSSVPETLEFEIRNSQGEDEIRIKNRG